MRINSQELVQSYVLTTAKYDFSVQEKRILYRLIEIAQADLQGKKLDGNYIIGETLFKDKILKLPINIFKPHNEDQNNSKIIKALRDLRNKTIEYDDGKIWQLIGIIEKPKFEYKGFVSFEVQPMIWKALLNFSKGFSKYELEIAMSFKTAYAMRFYELFSNNLQPLTFTIIQLKERFGLENKYKNNADFIKNVILKPKKELDEKAPFSFNFKKIKVGNKIVAIKFVPYEIEGRKKEKEHIKYVTNWAVPYEVKRYLKIKYGFDEKGIRSNINLFKKAYIEFDLLKFLSNIYPKASKARNIQAYTIGALKKYVSNKENMKPVSTEAVDKIEVLATKLSTYTSKPITEQIRLLKQRNKR